MMEKATWLRQRPHVSRFMQGQKPSCGVHAAIDYWCSEADGIVLRGFCFLLALRCLAWAVHFAPSANQPSSDL